MKYEEIKLGDVFTFLDDKETVISKSDKYRIITTIDADEHPTSWTEEDLHRLKPIKKELPKEGLLVHENGSLVYKLNDNSGYGFDRGWQSLYYFSKLWTFSTNDWKPATPEQKDKFIEMLKKECEARGLHEYTKIECHAKESLPKGALNQGGFDLATSYRELWNINGCIFYKGNFATPLKEESTLDQVTDAVKDIADFTIEESPTGLIILTPINK